MLLLALLATRLPLASSVPYDWDSVQYALAIDRFDPAEHRPQPPGSLLHVLAGRALLPVAGEAHAALLLEGPAVPAALARLEARLR